MTEHKQTEPTPAARPSAWGYDRAQYYWFVYDRATGRHVAHIDGNYEDGSEAHARLIAAAPALAAALQAVLDEDYRRRGYLPADVIEQVRAALALVAGTPIE